MNAAKIVPEEVLKFFHQMEEEPWFGGAVVNAFSVDSCGNNMLDYAVTNSDIDVIKYLVEEGVDVNNSGENGDTPLITAAYFEKYKICCYLLMMGADGRKENNNGISAFSILMGLD
jgi:ankyrin repeat protein